MLGDTAGMIQLERVGGTIWTKTHINHISMLSDFDKADHVIPAFEYSTFVQSCSCRIELEAKRSKQYPENASVLHAVSASAIALDNLLVELIWMERDLTVRGVM